MAVEVLVLPVPDDPAGELVVHSHPPCHGAARGAVLVFHDVFGVTGYVDDVAEALADAGWLGLAPALFHRTRVEPLPFDQYPTAEGHLLALSGAGFLADVDACLLHLRDLGVPPGRVGVIGFCMGGTLGSFVATCRPLGAVVSFYGQVGRTPWADVPPPLESVDGLRVPWLGLFGDADSLVPTSEVELLTKRLADCPVPAEIVRYPGAGHAFHRHSTPEYYHEPSATDAWTRALRWLDQYLPPA